MIIVSKVTSDMTANDMAKSFIVLIGYEQTRFIMSFRLFFIRIFHRPDDFSDFNIKRSKISFSQHTASSEVS